MTHALAKPPIVLIHGAFHGGWCWRPVAKILRTAGHETFAPTQTGLGERRHLLSGEITLETFVLDIVNLLESEDLRGTVVVGHSFGARTACGVADRLPERISQLVLLDGGLPHGGRSRYDGMSVEAVEERIASSMTFDGGISVPPPSADRFGIDDPEIGAWLESHLTPQPVGAEKTGIRLSNPLGNGLPVTYVRSVLPAFPGTLKDAEYAKARSDWTYREFMGGHNAIVTHPAEMAGLILEEIAIRA